MFFGEKIKLLREQDKLSVEDLVIELAQIGLRVSSETVRNWEKGVTYPNGDDIDKLAQFFNREPGYFFVQ